jgi:Fur family ferric uptake transcriptional regulator
VHHDNHVHFKCQHCQQTFCLHEVPIQSFPMPPGFVPNDYQLLISGTCPSCAPSA